MSGEIFICGNYLNISVQPGVTVCIRTSTYSYLSNTSNLPPGLAWQQLIVT